MTDQNLQKAVIYARVSSTKQLREGDGLASQETRCREYASYKDMEVLKVFRDDISGGSASRPGMIAMLNFLKKNRRQGCAVIIDDISRLARNLEAHLQLRTAIANAGGKLVSPSIEFGEDSDSVLVENLLASVSQHQRQKNGEQTRNRMRARAMGGYWVFQAPIGYRYEKTPGHGKLLVRDEPLATIAAEALDGYASGRFETPVEVKRFLQCQPSWPKSSNGEVHPERVTELLSRPVYAGYIHHEAWGIHFLPGKHEPLISLETWHAIQERRKGIAKAPTRKDLHLDFVLRGFVTCDCCGEPLTACWSKGRSRKYPYYLCDTKGCAEYRKSFRREKVEGAFEELLRELQPTEELFNLAFDMFRDLWDAKLKSSATRSAALLKEVRLIETKLDNLLDRIVDASSDSVVAAYENRIRALEEQKALAREKIATCGKPLAAFDETYRTAFAFLANPCKLWHSPRIEDRRAVLKLVFAEKLPYARNGGYRTAKISMPFKLLGDIKMNKSEVVRQKAFEPGVGMQARDQMLDGRDKRVCRNALSATPHFRQQGGIGLGSPKAGRERCCHVDGCGDASGKALGFGKRESGLVAGKDVQAIDGSNLGRVGEVSRTILRAGDTVRVGLGEAADEGVCQRDACHLRKIVEINAYPFGRLDHRGKPIEKPVIGDAFIIIWWQDERAGIAHVLGGTRQLNGCGGIRRSCADHQPARVETIGNCFHDDQPLAFRERVRFPRRSKNVQAVAAIVQAPVRMHEEALRIRFAAGSNRGRHRREHAAQRAVPSFRLHHSHASRACWG